MFTTRRKPVRRFNPTLASLEGRQLLSGLAAVVVSDSATGKHLDTVVIKHGPVALGSARLVSDAIQGNHIGTSAMIQGGHPGYEY